MALAKLPSAFRTRVIAAYVSLKARHAESKHEAAGICAGKLCECVIRLLQQEITGTHIPFGTKIPNFRHECEKLGQQPKASASESLRIVIPQALLFVYTLRNKRGIGHVGGDVDANGIDGATIARIADWVMCELIRVYHDLTLAAAQSLVASVSSRDLPVIWELAGKKRVLRSDLNFKQKTLLLLYGSIDLTGSAEDLFKWTRHTNKSVFKSTVLSALDRANLVDYDSNTGLVVISPLGVAEVEESILKGSPN